MHVKRVATDRFARGLLFVCALLLTLPCHAQVQKEELLSVIRAAESNLSNLRFSFRMEKHWSDPELEGTRSVEWLETSGVITTEAEPRFLVETTGMTSARVGQEVKEWGTRPFRAAASYDGRFGRQLTYLTRDNTMEGLLPSNGRITREGDLGFTRPFGWTLDLLLPFFGQLGRVDPAVAKQKGLLYYLENLPPENGPWTAELVPGSGIVRLVIPNSLKGLVDVVELDLARGATIVKAESWEYYGTPKASRGPGMSDVVLQEIQGVWLPVSFVVQGFGRYGTVTFEYEGVNESFQEEDFQLEFPSGVKVRDEARGVDYVVGGAERDRESRGLDAVLSQLVERKEGPEPSHEGSANAARSGTREVAEAVASSVVGPMIVAGVILIGAVAFVRRSRKRIRT